MVNQDFGEIISNINLGNYREDTNLSLQAKEITVPDFIEKSSKTNFHWAKIVLLWLFIGIVITIAIVVVLNMILPKGQRWLTIEEVTNLKSLLLSGIGGVIVGKFGEKLTS